jgi:hypothetical protein
MTNTDTIRAVKDAARHAYAWPGGYPKFVVLTDGAALCCKCAREEFARIARSTRDREHDGWAAAGVDINWEDTDLFCDHCNKQIESAYGND